MNDPMKDLRQVAYDAWYPYAKEYGVDFEEIDAEAKARWARVAKAVIDASGLEERVTSARDLWMQIEAKQHERALAAEEKVSGLAKDAEDWRIGYECVEARAIAAEEKVRVLTEALVKIRALPPRLGPEQLINQNIDMRLIAAYAVDAATLKDKQS